MTNQSAHWQLIDPKLHLYRYQGFALNGSIESLPIILVHDALGTHQSWDDMALYLWEAGSTLIYAVDVPEISECTPLAPALNRMRDIVDVVLAQTASAQQVVLLGYGVGGLLGYRYWQTWAEEAHLAYLGMLGTPHVNTIFQTLAELILTDNATEIDRSPEATYPIAVNRVSAMQERSSTVLLNIFGDGVGEDFDGVVRGLRLPEAVNYVLPLKHNAIHRDRRTAEFIIECLRGKRYQVKLKLVGLQMRRDDSANSAGPIAFDVDGMRFPPDTVFQPMTDRMYVFEDIVPPLCTLSYPADQVSTTITLHLRDLSNAGGRRRRMYTRLHFSLSDGDSTPHTMQDSEGSDFIWKVVCKRMPTVLGASWREELSTPVIRGI